MARSIKADYNDIMVGESLGVISSLQFGIANWSRELCEFVLHLDTVGINALDSLDMADITDTSKSTNRQSM